MRPSAFRLPPSAFRLPPSAFRLPPSAFRLPPSAFRLPPSAFRLPPSAFRPLPSARPDLRRQRRAIPKKTEGRTLATSCLQLKESSSSWRLRLRELAAHAFDARKGHAEQGNRHSA